MYIEFLVIAGGIVISISSILAFLFIKTVYLIYINRNTGYYTNRIPTAERVIPFIKPQTAPVEIPIIRRPRYTVINNSYTLNEYTKYSRHFK